MRTKVPNLKINRFFHTLIWKTGGSSTSDRNFMSGAQPNEWKDIKKLYNECKIRQFSISTHTSTYFFRLQHLFSYIHIPMYGFH